MPTSDTISTFGGFPCVNPRSLGDALAQGKRSAIYARRANSYRCPTGDAYGVGYCLLYGRDYSRIQMGTSAAFTLQATTNGSAESRTFPTMYPVRGTCIVPNNGDPRLSVYLLEFVDRRYFLARFSSCNVGYNVRCPGTSYGASTATDFYAATLNSGSLWTWAEIINNLTSRLGITVRNLLGVGEVPTTVPENLSFRGVRTWAALQSVLSMVGGELIYNPVADSFRIINAAQATNEIDSTLAARLLFDYDVTEMNGSVVPAAFDVCYRRVDRFAGCEPDMNRIDSVAKAWEPNGVYVVRVTTASAVTGSTINSIAGTVEPIWSSTPCLIGPDGEPAVSLIADANSIVQAAVRTRLGRLYSQRKTYVGLPSSVLPSSANKIVVWRDYGDAVGLVTESIAPDTVSQATLTEPDCESPDAILTPVKEFAAPPDFARHTKPSYPRGLSILSWGETPTETDDGNVNASVTQATGKQYVGGRILFLDPSDKDALAWNTLHDAESGQLCYIAVPFLNRAFAKEGVVPMTFPTGQILFGRLQGVADDNRPIFVVEHFHDFISGYLKVGETLTDDAGTNPTAIALGPNDIEFTVSGKYLPTGKKFTSASTGDTFLGWHADPTDVSDSGVHYWKVIVAKPCPVTA